MQAYGGRRSKESFSYEAFVPDPIAEADILLSGEIAAVVSDAEHAVRELNSSSPAFGSFEVLARQLLRAESIASSRIEGLVLSHRRLAKAAFSPGDTDDVDAESVVGNISAMEEAIRLGAEKRAFSVEDIRNIHQRLFAKTRDAHLAGVIRTEQNWVGGGLTPRDAEFIPPPPERVVPLLGDLCEFINREDLPGVAQAAIVHAQFETIHPFADGNGRVGRCLIHVVLRRTDLAPHYVPPISLVLATDARAYVRGLTAYRRGDWLGWNGDFASATRTAARKAGEFAGRVAVLQEEWRQRVGQRRDATAMRLIGELPGNPILDVKTASSLAGSSGEAARQAMLELEKVGVVRPLVLGRKRNRAWEAVGLFDLINTFERELATPEGATEPTRAAPARLQKPT
jgi:Fic family protein